MTNSPTIFNKIKHRITVTQAKRKLYKQFPEKKLSGIKQKNRQSLQLVNKWMHPDILKISVFNYGIMPEMEERVNCSIDNHTTYSDILGYLSMKLQKPIQYLEMGVSVGKNFWQMANLFEYATLTGFDIESINPLLEKEFEFENNEHWPSISALRKSPNQITNYQFLTNKIQYVSADEFDESAWQQLKGKKFNVFFSDALHDPNALQHEFTMLQKYTLLDEENFVLMWDDLGGSMTDAFMRIHQQLLQQHPTLFCARFITNGWMNYKNHHIGIITNIKF